MKLFFDFDDITKNLTDLSEVVEDNLLSEDLKNVIFRIKGESVDLVGVNQLITFVRHLEPDKVSVIDNDKSDEVQYMQLKSKELLGFLNSYKGLRQTTVEDLSLEIKDDNVNRVICKVVEMNEETGAKFISSWSFNNVMVKPNMLQTINKEEPEGDLETVDTTNIMFYTRNLFPLLQSGTNLYSKLTFGDDYVVAFNTAHMTFMKNYLSEAFQGVQLSYRAVAFMDKVLCNESTVQVTRTATDLFFKTDTSSAFIKYDNRLPEYKMYIEMFKRDSAISLDRIYLRDILRRINLIKDSVEFTIDDENQKIYLKNSKFEQELSIMKIKGMENIDRKRFKIMPEVLSKAIIGDDNEFSGELFIYYSPLPNKSAVLQFTDNSGSWFSSIQIKPY